MIEIWRRRRREKGEKERKMRKNSSVQKADHWGGRPLQHVQRAGGVL
jgi:hypothetical protein